MPHALFAGSTAGQLPYTKDMDLPSAMVQSPLHQRAALRTSAINYAQPVGLPSLDIVRSGPEKSVAAAPPSLPPSQHPLLPAQRRKRQQQAALERMRATAGADDPQGHGTVQANGAGANDNALCQPSLSPPILSWGSTEVIAHRHTLLPPALAAQLARISALHDSKMEAVAAAEQVANKYLENIPGQS